MVIISVHGITAEVLVPMLGNCVYRFEACGSAHCSLAPTGSLVPVKTMAEFVLRTQLAQMDCLATSPHGWEPLS